MKNDTISGLERISREYIRGYTRAIQDIIDIFECVNYDLFGRRIRMNYKWAKQILEFVLINRAKIRDRRNDGFVRVVRSETGKWDALEWYEPETKNNPESKNFSEGLDNPHR